MVVLTEVVGQPNAGIVNAYVPVCAVHVRPQILISYQQFVNMRKLGLMSAQTHQRNRSMPTGADTRTA